jgi:hypothetical protein
MNVTYVILLDYGKEVAGLVLIWFLVKILLSSQLFVNSDIWLCKKFLVDFFSPSLHLSRFGLNRPL